MNIAYLIMAHSQPAHLHRLINALNTNDTHFYVHVDQRSDMNDFLHYTYPLNVVFEKNRVSVHHAGFSLLKAMLQVLQTAYKNKDHLYFQFLSGFDYPIKSPQYILGTLQQHYPMNYINFYPLTHQADLVSSITKYYYTDTIQSMPPVLITPFKAFQWVVKQLPVKRPFFPGLVPYRGSCWFCLNRETVGYILDFVQTEKGARFLEYCKYVMCPDEIFFQTVVLNSPFAPLCRFYQQDIEQRHTPIQNENHAYLHQIDWDPARENPALLDMTDYERLKNSDAFYARKFHEAKSASLLKAIDLLIGVYWLAFA